MSTEVKPRLRYGLERRASAVEIDAFVGKEIKFLSPFQVNKLSVFFDRFFDHDLDGFLRENDIEDLLDRLKKYMEWEEDDPHFVATRDLYNSFFGCLKDQVTREMGMASLHVIESVSKNQWLNLWGRLTTQSTSILSFPVWVQMIPKHIFSVMDKDRDGKVSREELREFYEKFIGVTEDLDELTDTGYKAMTANGDYELNYDIYSMCFTNFLLGKTQYGPGKYIFGVFGSIEYKQTFKVNYDSLTE